ncbi:MAG: hypothetical protein L7S41_01015 [Candidatus Thalassarchaeaceae archaeon]|nr:hypothetical protein [Candidatus Thalassarchaeaceae archaeon]
MEGGAVRVIRKSPGINHSQTILLVLIFLLPMFSPITSVSAQTRISADDFEILDDLTSVLSERESVISSELVENLASPSLEGVMNSVAPTTSNDPLFGIDEMFSDATIVDPTPPEVVHPGPYDLLINPEKSPPGAVDTVWQTIFNLTDYLIWTKYIDMDGNQVEKFEVVTFTATLLSFLDSETNSLLHAVDIDNDGDNDIQVGLEISFDLGDEVGIEGDTLWIKPTISFTVMVLESSRDDSDWDELQTLQVSLLKAFAYSDGIFTGGESYVWVIDSKFTTQPDDFSIDIGIEKIFFDISDASSSLVASLISLIAGGISIPGLGGDASNIVLGSLSAPYAILINNNGQTYCPERYSQIELTTLPSSEISCGVIAGFGYVHFSPQDTDGNRDIWEVAYIEATIHPNGVSTRLPSEVNLVIRTDSTLSEGAGDVGENALDTIEYYADRRSDLHVHFHENKAGEPVASGESSGNSTDTIGWLRGMPAGSLSADEIDRIFTMLGSKSSPELPGGQPEKLGMIIAIKNFSKDSTQNVDDSTLPVNPAFPPKTLVLIRSSQSIQSIEYDSWHKRGDIITDHSKIHLEMKDLPTSIVLYGSFEFGSSSTSDTSLDSGTNLDFVSKILDSVILNLVDLFLDIGGIINSIPSEVVSVLTGDSGGVGLNSFAGRDVTLLMTDNLLLERVNMQINELAVQIGSSPHPVTLGDHVIISKDRNLNQVMGESGLREPLVPVASSIRFSGLSEFTFSDDDVLETQSISLITESSESFRFSFIEHNGDSLENLSFQSLHLSDIPNNISVMIDENSLNYIANEDIELMTYVGLDGEQRQGANIHDMPAEFIFEFGDQTSFIAESPISTVEVQISNSSAPITMTGDHFLFHHDSINETSTISTRLTGIQELGWISPVEEGAPGELGRGTAFLKSAGDRPMSINIDNAPTADSSGLSALALVDPLPSHLSVEIPTGNDGGSDLVIPEFNSTKGLSGVAFFIGGLSDFGRSINSVLAGFTGDISTGTEEVDDSFSYALQLESDTSFDLVVEATYGNPVNSEPPWVHGISFQSSPNGLSDGFHIKTWLPGLPPLIDLSISRTSQLNGEDWYIQASLDSWEPGREEFMIHAYGVNGQDLLLTMQGLEPGKSTNLFLDSVFEIRDSGGITEVSTGTQFGLSERLDWIHMMLINRDSQSRTEMLINEIPKSIALQASLGTAISIDMSVPEEERIEGFAVGSLMLQQMQWMDGFWWPATVFLKDIPGYINLTTAPEMNFDITKNLAFQGLPNFEFTSSDDGMSLYIEAFGRAINSRGDIILLAEGMTDKLIIKPTNAYGLEIRSSGSGVEKIYIRMNDVPTGSSQVGTPPVFLEEMEAMGENLRSATLHIRELVGPYSVIEVDDVDGGKIIASAKVTTEFAGREIQIRGVLIDAQTTGGVPTGTTLGVNGLSSDLSILNLVPGLSGSTHHVLVPEPFTSAILTVIATLSEGGN